METPYRIVTRDRKSGLTVMSRDSYHETPLDRDAAEKLVAFETAIFPDLYGPDADMVQTAEPIPPSPASVAQQWISSTQAVRLTSGEQIAACLHMVANLVEQVGEIEETRLMLVFQPSRGFLLDRDDKPVKATIDALAHAVGTYADMSEMSGGQWHYTTNHRPDSLEGVSVYTSVSAPVTPDPAEAAAEVPDELSPVEDGPR